MSPANDAIGECLCEKHAVPLGPEAGGWFIARRAGYFFV